MAYLDIRPNRKAGTAYRIKYRIDGKEKVTTFTDENIARHWLAIFNAVGPSRALHLLDQELQGASPLPTVREIVEEHITDLTGVTDGTRAEYRREAARDIYPTLGDLPITLLAGALPAWVNDLDKRLAGKTIANRHGLLSGACATAVRAGHLPANPCKGMRLPRGIRAEMVCLEPEEFRAIHARLDAFWRPLATTLAGTGMRWGEITALQIGDVSESRMELRVQRAWKHRRREIGPPKTAASNRVIAFGPPVLEALAPLLAGRRRDEFVFLSKRGAAIPANSFHGWAWGPAVKAAYKAGELRAIPRVHDLRHTYASWLLGQGIAIIVVQRLMGHESITTTVDTYGHLLPDARLAAAAAASTALQGHLAQVATPGPPAAS